MSRRMWILGVAMAGLLAAWAAAQEPATGGVAVAAEAIGADTVAQPAGAEVAMGMTWRDMIRYGGWLMYPLAAISLVALAFIVYFAAVLRAEAIAPRALHRELVEKLREGDVEEARRASEYRRCPLASIALTGIQYLRHVKDLDPVLLKDVMQGEGGRQAEAIEGQTQYLMDVASVAPMLGLLGTVVGMMKAFGAVATDMASARPVVLAAGVAQALITTAFGLVIGIPAMIAYSYFRRRASKLVATLENAATDVLTALLIARKPRGGAPNRE